MKRGDHTSVVVACCHDIRCVIVAPGVYKILVVAREERRVPTFLVAQTHGLAVLVSYIYLTVRGPKGSSLIVDIASLGIVSIDRRDVIVATNGAMQLSVHRVYIELHETATVAGQQHIVAYECHSLHSLLLNIFLHMLLHDELCHGAAWVHAVEAELVLMAVHGVDHHLACVICGLDAGHVAVGVKRHLQLTYAVRLNVVAPCRHLAVILASLRIFV